MRLKPVTVNSDRGHQREPAEQQQDLNGVAARSRSPAYRPFAQALAARCSRRRGGTLASPGTLQRSRPAPMREPAPAASRRRGRRGVLRRSSRPALARLLLGVAVDRRDAVLGAAEQHVVAARRARGAASARSRSVQRGDARQARRSVPCGPSRPALTWRRIHESPQITAITIAGRRSCARCSAPPLRSRVRRCAGEARFSGLAFAARLGDGRERRRAQGRRRARQARRRRARGRRRGRTGKRMQLDHRGTTPRKSRPCYRPCDWVFSGCTVAGERGARVRPARPAALGVLLDELWTCTAHFALAADDERAVGEPHAVGEQLYRRLGAPGRARAPRRGGSSSASPAAGAVRPSSAHTRTVLRRTARRPSGARARLRRCARARSQLGCGRASRTCRRAGRFAGRRRA